MFTAALVTVAKKWKICKRQSTDEWINKLGYIHTVQYYLMIKRMKYYWHATTWMDSENTMLSERSQTQKIYDCMIPFK